MTANTLANAFTVDVEDYFHVAALSSVIDRADWGSYAPRVQDNTQRLLDLLESHGIRATFFVLGWVADRAPGLVREIHDRGHEVACHGMSHRMIYDQSPDEFRRETSTSKDLLEQTIGSAVDGYRAASYSITKDSLWALDIIVEAGFRYDSSVFPVRHDLYGLPGSQRAPHRLAVGDDGREIVEFPPCTVRVLGQNVPAGGGGYFRLYPYGLTRYLLRRVVRELDAPFMFYIHPWEIDTEQPRVNAKLRSRFRHYVNLDKCERRLNRLLRDFHFDTVRNVLSGLGLLRLENPA